MIKTPIAIIASKGPEDDLEDPSAERERDVKSVVEAPSRSPAPREEEVVDWIWEAAKSLWYKSARFWDLWWVGCLGRYEALLLTCDGQFP